jgi:hypothetical protein
MTHESPSVECIDQAKGFVEGNVRVISVRAHVFKHQIKRDLARPELGGVYTKIRSDEGRPQDVVVEEAVGLPFVTPMLEER